MSRFDLSLRGRRRVGFVRSFQSLVDDGPFCKQSNYQNLRKAGKSAYTDVSRKMFPKR